MSKNKKSNPPGAQEPSVIASGSSSGPPTDAPPRYFWLGVIVILLATFLVYQPLKQASFIWDDNIMLTDNPLVQTPGHLDAIWFSTQPHDYFPLTLTALWVEWRMFGLK